MRKKFNICIFCGDMSKGGGTQRMTQVLAEALHISKEWQVIVLDINNNTNNSYYQLPNEVVLESLPTDCIRNTIKRLRSFLRTNDIDIIIDVDVMLGIYTFPATFLTRTKVISWEMFSLANDIGSRHSSLIRQMSLLLGSYYITLTENDRDCFKKRFHIRCPIDYVYNPCTLKADNVSYNPDIKIIMTAGGFFYTKGYDLAVKVAQRVLSAHKDWIWRFYGDGPERDKIVTLIHEFGLDNRVVVMPRTNNIIEAYTNSSLYVMTSRLEGFGLVLVEAKQCHLPTVAFDCECGPREIIQDGSSGYLIPAFDIDEMANKLNNILEDRELRIKLAEHATDNLKRFSFESFKEKWEAILKETLI